MAIQVTGAATATDDIWVWDLTRGTSIRLTLEGNNGFPVWTPNTRLLTFWSDREETNSLFQRRGDGSGEPEKLVTSELAQRPYSWSSDARLLAGSGGGDVWVLSMDGDRTPQRFAPRPYLEFAPTFSPDGRWLAYTSDESGRLEVYVQPYPPSGDRWQVSTAGGEEPIWSPAGDELFYRYNQRWFVASVELDGTLTLGRPELLFEGEYLNVPGLSYDVAADGQRFLMIKTGEGAPATELRVVLDWFDELERLVPGRR